MRKKIKQTPARFCMETAKICPASPPGGVAAPLRRGDGIFLPAAKKTVDGRLVAEKLRPSFFRERGALAGRCPARTMAGRVLAAVAGGGKIENGRANAGTKRRENRGEKNREKFSNFPLTRFREVIE